jgi:hypothetical protein
VGGLVGGLVIDRKDKKARQEESRQKDDKIEGRRCKKLAEAEFYGQKKTGTTYCMKSLFFFSLQIFR